MKKLPDGTIVYAEDYSCVHNGTGNKGAIYIGNLEAAQNLTTLKRNNIKAILTASKGTDLRHPKSDIPYYLYLPCQDRQDFDLYRYFMQAASFLRQSLQHTNVMVHCLAGVSRSVSLVMAYLIKYHNMSTDESFQYIKSRRRIIHPNNGFLNQLKKFEIQCKTQNNKLKQIQYQIYQTNNKKMFQSNLKNKYDKDYLPYRYALPLKSNYKNITHSPKAYGDKIIQTQKRPKSSFQDCECQLRKSLTMNSNAYITPKRNAQSPKSRQTSPRKSKIYSIYSSQQYQPHNLYDRAVANKEARSSSLYKQTIYRKKEDYRQKGVEIQPLSNVDNAINAQIDGKIAAIRKKYQEYATGPYGSYASKNRKLCEPENCLSELPNQKFTPEFNNKGGLSLRASIRSQYGTGPRRQYEYIREF